MVKFGSAWPSLVTSTTVHTRSILKVLSFLHAASGVKRITVSVNAATETSLTIRIS